LVLFFLFKTLATTKYTKNAQPGMDAAKMLGESKLVARDILHKLCKQMWGLYFEPGNIVSHKE
jgi:hypothetical protein